MRIRIGILTGCCGQDGTERPAPRSHQKRLDRAVDGQQRQHSLPLAVHCPRHPPFGGRRVASYIYARIVFRKKDYR